MIRKRKLFEGFGNILNKNRKIKENYKIPEKYEEQMTIISELISNNKGVIIDIGANVGYYTRLFAKHNLKVYAIEPCKKTFEHLKRNVKEKNVIFTLYRCWL